MRRSLGIATAVLTVLSSISWASAAPNHGPDNQRPPLGNNPHPVASNSAAPNHRPDNPRPPLGNNPCPLLWSSTKPKPAQPVSQPPADTLVGAHRNDRNRDDDRDRDSDERHRRVYVLRQIVFVPVDEGYGVQNAVPDDWGRPWPNGGVFVPPPREGDLPEPPEPKRVVERGTNERSLALAWKFIGYGDALFAKQRYAEAKDCYRKAIRNAPQLADACFREAFAMAAIGRSDLAAAAIKRGLKFDPAWPKSHFEIEGLFGHNAATKDAMLDALADGVIDKPTDCDRLYVLGVCLYFDGQSDRAATLFDRARPLAGNDLWYIEAFLSP